MKHSIGMISAQEAGSVDYELPDNSVITVNGGQRIGIEFINDLQQHVYNAS